MGRVVVVGSLNCDHTVTVDRFPRVGETVRAVEYRTDLGGKGFNQAVTAARMGADVVMVGCVGADGEGDELLAALHREGVDTGYVRHHAELPTGHAQITVDAYGYNTIVIAPGANSAASFPSAALEDADVVLVQLEIPFEVVVAAIRAARGADIVTILNCAPPRQLTEKFLGLVDYLVANQTEADQLGQVDYRGIAIITRGDHGAVVLVPGREPRQLPAFGVPVVDTTAAGDAFCGCFAACIAEGRTRVDALNRASAAGAHAVTARGTYASLPQLDDVERMLRQPRIEAQN